MVVVESSRHLTQELGLLVLGSSSRRLPAMGLPALVRAAPLLTAGSLGHACRLGEQAAGAPGGRRRTASSASFSLSPAVQPQQKDARFGRAGTTRSLTPGRGPPGDQPCLGCCDQATRRSCPGFATDL